MKRTSHACLAILSYVLFFIRKFKLNTNQCFAGQNLNIVINYAGSVRNITHYISMRFRSLLRFKVIS